MELEWGQIFALAGAALSAAFAGIGSARGVGIAGEAAAGVVAENPDNFGRCLVLQALPGTQGIYGLIIWFMVMNKTGLMSGDLQPVTPTDGLIMLAASAIMGFGGYFSAVAQGKTAATGIAMVGRRPEESGKAIVMATLVETYAVFSLIASLLIILFL